MDEPRTPPAPDWQAAGFDLEGDDRAEMAAQYVADMRKKFGDDPASMFPLLPFMLRIYGDEMVRQANFRTRAVLAEAVRKYIDGPNPPEALVRMDLRDLADRMERGDIDIGDLVGLRRKATEREREWGDEGKLRVCWCPRPDIAEQRSGQTCKRCGCVAFLRRGPMG